MELYHHLAISYYKTIATINEPHQIYLVQHQDSKKIYIKKILDIYNIDIYQCLSKNPIMGTPKIIDYLEENKQLIVIEEFISGSSLLEMMENRHLSFNDILNYMLDLCNILEKLHFHNPAIVHRDIKPSNIIITNYNRAVLLDFNAAKYYSSTSSEDTMLLGTHGYAAPEQYGFGSSSPQTDIYSLGILLKEMTSAISFSSPKLNAIIDKCTQMSPDARFRNIKELRGSLLALMNPAKQSPFPNWLQKFAPPGFRTMNPWKMILAFLGYLFISWCCFTMEIENISGSLLWFERLIIFAMMLSIVFGHFNYLNIQRLMPLCQRNHRYLKFIGTVLLNVSVISLLMILLITVEFLFAST